MSDKKQSKVSLRKRIIRRIVQHGGTSTIVGSAYLERSSSPSYVMKKNLTNREKRQLNCNNMQQPLDYSLPGDSGVAGCGGGQHSDNLQNAMNLYIRRPFKN